MGAEPVLQALDVIARHTKPACCYAARKMRQFAEYAQMFAIVFAAGGKLTALHQLALVLEVRPRMLTQACEHFRKGLVGGGKQGICGFNEFPMRVASMPCTPRWYRSFQGIKRPHV